MYNSSWCLRSQFVSKAGFFSLLLLSAMQKSVCCMSKIHNKSCDQYGRDKTSRRTTTVGNYNGITKYSFVSYLQESLRCCRNVLFFLSLFDKVLFVGLFVFVKYDHFLLLLPQPQFIFIKHFVCVTK